MIYKAWTARASSGEAAAPDLHLVATEPFPYGELSAVVKALHEQAAREIADALWASLPGGTIDRLVAIMVERHATLLIRRYDEPARAGRGEGEGCLSPGR